MVYLVDTNILARLANPSDPQEAVASNAALNLRRANHTLVVAPQNLVEFRNCATRPVNKNGLGLPPAAADALLTRWEAEFQLIAETADIYPAWRRLVQQVGVIGKQIHDARIAAVCDINAIQRILTFDQGHFTAYLPFVPGLVVVHPASV